MNKWQTTRLRNLQAKSARHTLSPFERTTLENLKEAKRREDAAAGENKLAIVQRTKGK
jgi:hypothetical protein